MTTLKNASMKTPKPQFLNEKQVEVLTGISVSTLRNQRWLSTGLPYIKLGRSVFYEYSDIMAHMRAHKVVHDDWPDTNEPGQPNDAAEPDSWPMLQCPVSDLKVNTEDCYHCCEEASTCGPYLSICEDGR